MAENDEEEKVVEPEKSGGKGTIIVALVCLIIGAVGGFFGAGFVNTSSPEAGAPDGKTTITDLGEFTVKIRRQVFASMTHWDTTSSRVMERDKNLAS